jgi:hypothetical protein
MFSKRIGTNFVSTTSRRAPCPLKRGECATENEFGFKDYPNEIKFAPVTDQAIAEISTQYDLVHMIEKDCFIEVATNERAAPLMS